MKKHVLAALFALCILTALLPATAMAGTGAIQMNADGIADPDGSGTSTVYNYVYFGKNGENPVKWRVLDAHETNTGGRGMFLLSDGLLTLAQRSRFRDYIINTVSANDDINSYQESELREFLVTNEGSILNTVFSARERGAMLETTKSDGVFTVKNYSTKPISFSASDTILDGDKLFPLSAEETENTDYFPKGITDCIAPTATLSEVDMSWWLRSPVQLSSAEPSQGALDYTSLPIWVGTIGYDGKTDRQLTLTSLFLRPAFNLDRVEVFMISGAKDGKLSDDDVPSRPYEISTYTPREWKLTLKDNSRNFLPLSVSASGNELTIRYIDAKTGANEYISAIVEDDESHNITHYGRVLSLSEGPVDGTVKVTLPENMKGKTLSVFNEQYNGNYKTDFASSACSIEYCAIETDCSALNFGRVFKGETPPDARTVTVTNTGRQSVAIDLPTLDNYTITAGEGFSNGKATLDVGGKASFTVQPNKGLGVGKHNGTITLSGANGVNSASAEISATFLVSEPVAAIQHGTNAIENPNGNATPSAYSYIYFGKDGSGNPNKWRVLDKNKTNSQVDGMFLLSEDFINNDRPQFHHTTMYYGYKSSDLRGVLNGVLNNAFTDTERYYIYFTTKSSGSTGNNDSLNEDMLFPLSWDEANSDNYFPNGGIDRKKDDNWWLRTPHGSNNARFIDSTGGFTVSEEMGARSRLRPAINLDADDVLFVSAANGGKEAEGMDKGLTAVGKSNTDSWKLTLHDSNRELDAVSKSTSGNKLTLEYSEAKTGDNEYISAAIKDASGNITHYGRILRLSEENDSNGTVTVTLPDDMSGKALYLINEQYNGGKKTDYANSVTITYNAIKATAETTLDFGAAYTGYEQPAARTVTVASTGTVNQPVTVNLPTLDNFTITAGEGFSEGEGGVTAELVKIGDTATFTVQPNAELGVGTYDGELEVKGSALGGSCSASDTLNVTFSVADFVYALSATPETLDFGSVTTGYTRPQAQKVTVTNTGNQSVTFSLPTLDNYAISADTGFIVDGDNTTATLAANGDTATFTVQPNADLKAGPHDGTITVDGDNGASAAVGVTFTVNTAPGIAGAEALMLEKGYTATETNAYTVTGQPAPTVTKTSGDAAITWNDADKKLHIAQGLDVGVYPVTLSASNGVLPDASFTFTLTVGSVSDPVYYEITAEANDGAYGEVTGGGTYRGYSLVTLTATANDGYRFVKWTENGADVETANPLSFYAMANRTLTAVFGVWADPPAKENAILGVAAGENYVKGDEVTFTAQGVGMDNDSPEQNDTRWLPTAWKANPSGNFDSGYTQRFSTADMKLGSHTLSVEFTKQRFAGEAWETVAPAVTDTKRVDFTVIAAPPSALGLETLALKPGHSFDLNRLTGGAEGSWSISDPIAAINAKNRLTPKKRGSTELTFTYTGGSHQRVTLHVVKPALEVSKVVPKAKKYILAPGDTLAPEASVKPKNAAYPQILWTNENAELLKKTGKGEFKALAVGQTTLLATATSGKTAEIKVVVTDVPHSIALDRKKATLKKDEKLKLILESYLPASLPAPSLVWTSSNVKVASVDENGTVTAHKTGKATITAKASGAAKAKVKITVK